MDKVMTRLYRSQHDKKVFGLCGGLAEAYNIDVTILRLVVVVTAFFSAGTTLLLYLLACMVIPSESGLEPAYSNSGVQRNTCGAKRNNYHQESTNYSREPSIDEMMKGLEEKALRKEIEELKAKVAKYEKGDV